MYVSIWCCDYVGFGDVLNQLGWMIRTIFSFIWWLIQILFKCIFWFIRIVFKTIWWLLKTTFWEFAALENNLNWFGILMVVCGLGVDARIIFITLTKEATVIPNPRKDDLVDEIKD